MILSQDGLCPDRDSKPRHPEREIGTLNHMTTTYSGRLTSYATSHVPIYST